MRNINQETDINAGSSAFEMQPQSQVLETSTDEPRKGSRQTYETLCTKLLSAVKIGNIRDQILLLESWYQSELEDRQRIHVRKISRTRFLRQVQNFLAVRGLVLGKGVQTAYLRTPLCN